MVDALHREGTNFEDCFGLRAETALKHTAKAISAGFLKQHRRRLEESLC